MTLCFKFLASCMYTYMYNIFWDKLKNGTRILVCIWNYFWFVELRHGSGNESMDGVGAWGRVVRKQRRTAISPSTFATGAVYFYKISYILMLLA